MTRTIGISKGLSGVTPGGGVIVRVIRIIMVVAVSVGSGLCQDHGNLHRHVPDLAGAATEVCFANRGVRPFIRIARQGASSVRSGMVRIGRILSGTVRIGRIRSGMVRIVRIAPPARSGFSHALGFVSGYDVRLRVDCVSVC